MGVSTITGLDLTNQVVDEARVGHDVVGPLSLAMDLHVLDPAHRIRGGEELQTGLSA